MSVQRWGSCKYSARRDSRGGYWSEPNGKIGLIDALLWTTNDENSSARRLIRYIVLQDVHLRRADWLDEFPSSRGRRAALFFHRPSGCGDLRPSDCSSACHRRLHVITRPTPTSPTPYFDFDFTWQSRLVLPAPFDVVRSALQPAWKERWTCCRHHYPSGSISCCADSLQFRKSRPLPMRSTLLDHTRYWRLEPHGCISVLWCD